MRKTIPILAYLFCTNAFGAIAVVQVPAAVSGSGGVVSVSFTNPVASGDTVIYDATCVGGGTEAFTSIVDDKSDTFGAPDVDANLTASQNALVVIGHLSNITSGAKTFTFTGANCAYFTGMKTYELSGASGTVDVATSHDIANAVSPQTFAYTVAQSGEFAVSVWVQGTATTSITGWTTDLSLALSGGFGYLLSPTIGSNTWTDNFSGSSGVAVGIVTYDASAGPACTHAAWVPSSSGALTIPVGGTTTIWKSDGSKGTTPCDGTGTKWYQPANSGALGTQ